MDFVKDLIKRNYWYWWNQKSAQKGSKMNKKYFIYPKKKQISIQNWFIHLFQDKIQFKRLFNIGFFKTIKFKRLFIKIIKIIKKFKFGYIQLEQKIRSIRIPRYRPPLTVADLFLFTSLKICLLKTCIDIQPLKMKCVWIEKYLAERR